MAEPSLIERLRHQIFSRDKAKAAGHIVASDIHVTPEDARALLSTLEDQARLIGECRSVMVAVMQERRGYFGLVDALLTKLKAFGERDE